MMARVSKLQVELALLTFFAEFYEALYASQRLQAQETPRQGQIHTIHAFSVEELDDALKTIKRNKGRDAKGIVAEMYQHSGPKLRETLLSTINDTIHPAAEIPSEW